MGDDLKPAIVLSVKHAPIPELLAIVLEPAKCSMHCGRSTVQLLCDLVVRHLQVVVELPYALDHKSSDLVAPQLGLGFGPALDPLLLDELCRQEATPELPQLFTGSDLSNRGLRLLFCRYLLHHCLHHCCSYYVKIASSITAL